MLLKNLSFLFAFLLVFPPLAAAENHSIKISAWNLARENGASLPAKYLKSMLLQAKQELFEIACLQGIQAEEEDLLRKAFTDERLEIIFFPLNSAERARTAIAFRKDLFELKTAAHLPLVDVRYWPTFEMHGFRDHPSNLGVTFHKSLGFVELHDKREADLDNEFFVFITHLGQAADHQKKATREIKKLVRLVTGKLPYFLFGNIDTSEERQLDELLASAFGLSLAGRSMLSLGPAMILNANLGVPGLTVELMPNYQKSEVDLKKEAVLQMRKKLGFEKWKLFEILRDKILRLSEKGDLETGKNFNMPWEAYSIQIVDQVGLLSLNSCWLEKSGKCDDCHQCEVDSYAHTLIFNIATQYRQVAYLHQNREEWLREKIFGLLAY